MAKSDTPERDALDRLTDALVEDILNMSDEDILAEYREGDDDPERNRQEMRALLEKSLLIANERRMVTARAGTATDRVGRPANAARAAERTDEGNTEQ